MEKVFGGLILVGFLGCIATFMVGIISGYILFGLRSFGLYHGDPVDAIVPKVLGIAALFWCIAAFGAILLFTH